MKTVRFSRLVESYGKPTVHTRWVAPEKDAELKRARAASRVLTVEHAKGKTEVGVVGFDENSKAHSQVLIFPKSLHRLTGARVVGIKFDLVEQPDLAPVGDRRWTAPSKSTRRRSHKPARRTGAQAAEIIAFPAASEAMKATEAAAPARRRAVDSARAPRRQRPASRPRSRDAGTQHSQPLPRNVRSRGAAPAAKPAERGGPLERQVRAALKELERGQAVAAYRRLERALKSNAKASRQA